MKTAAVLASRQAMRAGTRADHDRLDARFANGLRSDADYAVYLRGMQGFVRSVDARMATTPLSPSWRAWSLTPRAQWLQADLDALSLAPIEAPRFAMSAQVDDETDAGDARDDCDRCVDARAAGAMYVVEGSALGARELLDDAHRLGHDAERGATFLTRHAQGEDGRRWPRFTDALGDDSFAHPACQAGMVRAAVAAFAHADACFRLAADSPAGRAPAGSTGRGSPTDLPAIAGSAPSPHARNT